MNTIEERAKEYVGNSLYSNDVTRKQYSYRGYVIGATDQNKIDIEKAWDIFKALIDDREGEDGYCEIWYITKEQFKQAMEE